MDMLNILGYRAKKLIDCGATHSVISHTFAQLTQPHYLNFGGRMVFPRNMALAYLEVALFWKVVFSLGILG